MRWHGAVNMNRSLIKMAEVTTITHTYEQTAVKLSESEIAELHRINKICAAFTSLPAYHSPWGRHGICGSIAVLTDFWPRFTHPCSPSYV